MVLFAMKQWVIRLHFTLNTLVELAMYRKDKAERDRGRRKDMHIGINANQRNYTSDIFVK